MSLSKGPHVSEQGSPCLSARATPRPQSGLSIYRGSYREVETQTEGATFSFRTVCEWSVQLCTCRKHSWSRNRQNGSSTIRLGASLSNRVFGMSPRGSALRWDMATARVCMVSMYSDMFVVGPNNHENLDCAKIPTISRPAIWCSLKIALDYLFNDTTMRPGQLRSH